MSARTWIVTAAVLVLAMLVYAWVDGGREPLRTIVIPVRPGAAR